MTALKRSRPRKTASAPARVEQFFAGLGPGLITGAADDDPSGISTYSVTGASFGYAPLWVAVASFPLMVSVQLMCARLGMVTGKGLAGVIRSRYSRWVLWGACSLLVVANVINIGADLAGMAEATELVTGLSHRALIPSYGVVIVLLLFFSSYRHIARVFKWLTLVLFAYVGAGILAHPAWGTVLRATFVPHIEWSARYFSVLVGVLGTTISPYLFFWQAAEEVEEERAIGRGTERQRRGATQKELRRSFIDVLVGMFFSNVVMYFVILTTAATLHRSGQTNITTAREAAEALRPLAGPAAYWLFTLGLVGTGMLGVPVLAGSCAYTIAEASRWRGSLEDRPNSARRFYAVVAIAVLVGLLLNIVGLNAVAMLFWSAVVNGVLAPPLVVVVLLLTSSRAVMGTRANPPLLRWLGWTTAAAMSAAAVAMIVTAWL
jgi:NRAMP (natural resistance-associated macrophage protein)-like metal ion transporter